MRIRRGHKNLRLHLPHDHILMFTSEGIAHELLSPHEGTVPDTVKTDVRDVFMLGGHKVYIFFHELFSYNELKVDQRMKRGKAGDDRDGMLLFCPQCKSNKAVTLERMTDVHVCSGLERNVYFCGFKYRCANWNCPAVQRLKVAYEKKKNTTIGSRPSNSAEHFSRSTHRTAQLWTGFSLPRSALQFHDGR